MPDRKRTVAAKASLALSRAVDESGIQADVLGVCDARVRTEGQPTQRFGVVRGQRTQDRDKGRLRCCAHPRCGAGEVAGA